MQPLNNIFWELHWDLRDTLIAFHCAVLHPAGLDALHSRTLWLWHIRLHLRRRFQPPGLVCFCPRPSHPRFDQHPFHTKDAPFCSTNHTIPCRPAHSAACGAHIPDSDHQNRPRAGIRKVEIRHCSADRHWNDQRAELGIRAHNACSDCQLAGCAICISGSCQDFVARPGFLWNCIWKYNWSRLRMNGAGDVNCLAAGGCEVGVGVARRHALAAHPADVRAADRAPAGNPPISNDDILSKVSHQSGGGLTNMILFIGTHWWHAGQIVWADLTYCLLRSAKQIWFIEDPFSFERSALAEIKWVLAPILQACVTGT